MTDCALPACPLPAELLGQIPERRSLLLAEVQDVLLPIRRTYRHPAILEQASIPKLHISDLLPRNHYRPITTKRLTCRHGLTLRPQHLTIPLHPDHVTVALHAPERNPTSTSTRPDVRVSSHGP